MIAGVFNRLKRWYYQGPVNMGAIRVPRFVGYQTVTLTTLHWLGYFINKHFTTIGRIILLISGLMIPYCLFDPKTLPMSYMAFSIISIYLVNMVIGFIFMPSIKVSRQLPSQATCGYPVTATYQIENTRSVDLWDIKVDALFYPGVSRKSVPYFPTLPAKSSQSTSAELVFYHRGNVFIPQVYIESAFPFGFWKWGKFGTGNCCVKVLPAALNVKFKHLPFLIGGNNSENSESIQGSGMEFASCREYRFGDNPKNIHWLSWARTSIPIIKEMTNESQPPVNMFFDPCYKVNMITKYQDIQDNFEIAMSFFVGLSQYLCKKNYSIKNIIMGSDLHALKSNNSLDAQNEILTICADLQDVRKVLPINLHKKVYDTVSSGFGFIVVLQNIDESRLKFLKTLEDSGIKTQVYLLGTQEPKVTGNWTFLNYKTLRNNTTVNL